MKKIIPFIAFVVFVYGLYLAWKNRARLAPDASLEKMNEAAKTDYGKSLPNQNTDAIVIHRWGRAMTQSQYNKIKWKLSLLDDWRYTFGPSMSDEEFVRLLGE